MSTRVTEIRFINEHGEHKVAVVEENMTAGDVLRRLVVPTMLCAGYAYSSISREIKDEV